VIVSLNQADAPAARSVPEGLAIKAAALLCVILFALVVIGAVAESAIEPIDRLNPMQLVWP